MRYLLLGLAVLLLPARLVAGAAAQVVASSRLVETARQALLARLASSAGEAELSAIGAPEDVRVGPGTVSLNVRPVIGHWPRPRVGVPVDVLVDGHVARSTTVWFALSLHGRVLTYGGDFPIDTMASSVPMQLADVDVAALQDATVAEPAELEGMRLRKPAQAGAPVLKSDFERIPDVDRKQKVSVLVSYGAIRLATHGVANAMGNAGNMVPVLVDGADAPVQARVTEKGVVEVVQ
ncbi:flagellar basal body P-ring formation chaperone FlgA [Dyella sedimenti]|uniref:flagellar basal body P-ring formation chaperone FlgA n=1 Tax=Dyella sedimenti TaxID=2919947 RepID=UPI001FA9ADC5|nr:flagellar basal body P-ring formation chaperone FlgA [Dyella sedimenti]